MRLALALALATGCGPAPGLVFEPDRLDFGEVDFAGELPEDGYDSHSVQLVNKGNKSIALSLPEYDTDRLCLAGFGGQDFPVDLGELPPDASYTFIVGLCGYGTSGIDTLMELELAVDGGDDRVSLPISFTPIRTSE